jgi:hypothetical protein
LQTLEVMAADGWVSVKYDKTRPRLALTTPEEGDFIHKNREDATTARRPRA